MKDSFREYYAPSKTEYEHLIKEALVVFDANVLLDLYRLPTATTDALLATLRKISDRIWIPFNVGLEYQRNRLEVIAASRARLDDLVEDGRKALRSIESNTARLELDKRGLDENAGRLSSAIKATELELQQIADTTKKTQVDVGLADPVRDQLDALFAGRVGPKPLDQAWLDNILKEGIERYNSKIPPGFSDAGKGGVTVEGGLVYQRRFGDLVLWKQLLQHVRDNDRKWVLLVTNDKKEDWWIEESGRKIGPHPQLLEEMNRIGGCPNFWIYSLRQFTEQARAYVDATLSDAVVEDVREVEARAETLGEWAMRSFVHHSHGQPGPEVFVSAVWELYAAMGSSSASMWTTPPAVIVSEVSGNTRLVRIFNWSVDDIYHSDFEDLIQLAVDEATKHGYDVADVVLFLDDPGLSGLFRSRMNWNIKEWIGVARNIGAGTIRVGYLDDNGRFAAVWTHEGK